ncbi:MAG: orotidine 5'-phosphate decarboxylase / HUMPS family protein [Patescibacteria group bacterium]
MIGDVNHENLGNSIVLALDSRDLLREKHVLDDVGPEVGMIKIAPKRVTPRDGTHTVNWNAVFKMTREIAPNAGVVLDFKISDVPGNTEDIITDLALTGANMISVHSLSTSGSLEAAVKARRKAKIIAHTIDSRESENGCRRLLGKSITQAVCDLSLLAAEAGVDALFVPSFAVESVRNHAELAKITLVATGIAVPDYSTFNHLRSLTPRQAMDAGADYFVVGRAFTDEQNDPQTVLSNIIDNLS